MIALKYLSEKKNNNKQKNTYSFEPQFGQKAALASNL